MFLNPNLFASFLFFIMVLLLAQVYLLLRVRNILNAVSMNFDSVIYFCRKFALNQLQSDKKSAETRAKSTCQFCRHRLAYINTSKTRNEEEDFYFKCALRNVHIGLKDSCEEFEADPEAREES